MATDMDTDVLSIDGEVARIGGGQGNGFYLVNTPKSAPKLKIAKACQMELVILPYKTTCSPRVAPGKLYFFRDYYRYFELGPAGKDSYFDCAQTFGEKCPIVDAFNAAGIKKRPQRMGLFNVLVLTIDGEPVNKVHTIDFSYVNFAQKLFDAANAKKKRRGQEHAGTFADPKAGSVITFDWKEETMPLGGKKYFVGDNFDFAKHNGLDGEVAKAMADAVDLDAILNKLPYAEAKAKFIDCVPVDEPAPRTEAKPKAKKEEEIPAPPVDSDAPFDEDWPT